jgi:hypothetical protein
VDKLQKCQGVQRSLSSSSTFVSSMTCVSFPTTAALALPPTDCSRQVTAKELNRRTYEPLAMSGFCLHHFCS